MLLRRIASNLAVSEIGFMLIISGFLELLQLTVIRKIPIYIFPLPGFFSLKYLADKGYFAGIYTIISSYKRANYEHDAKEGRHQVSYEFLRKTSVICLKSGYSAGGRGGGVRH
jgi:hypothetical protein